MVKPHDHDDELARYGVCLTCSEAGDTDAAAVPAPAQQLTFAEQQPDGDTYEPTQDRARLGAQMLRVATTMADGCWRTLAELATETGDPEASVSARLRDLRKPAHGGHSVHRRHRGDPARGLYEYRLDAQVAGMNAGQPMPPSGDDGAGLATDPTPTIQEDPAMTDPSHHITMLKVRNVRRIQAVQIEPDGNLVVIAGANGEGKTSVLDAIWLALGGGKAQREIPDPLRHGAASGEAEVHVGGLVVRRTWTADGKSKLHVTNADGHPVRQQQTFLDSLVGDLSFDPLVFANADERTQRATLLPLLNLPFDPDELALRRQGVFDRRTEVNRQVRTLTDRLAGMEPPGDDVPDEPVDAADLRTQYREAVEQRSENEAVTGQLAMYEHDVQTITAEIEDMEQRLAERRAGLAAALAKRDDLKVQAEFLETPDLDAIEAALAAVDETNEQVRVAQEYRDTETQLAAWRQSADDLTAELERVDRERDAAMAEVDMPIEGLGVTDDGVTFQGVPLAGASGAERLRVSVAIAMALNPELRVLRITDGSLLDSKSMAMLEDQARELDFQVWIEVVDESGEHDWTIEDGMVAGATG